MKIHRRHLLLSAASMPIAACATHPIATEAAKPPIPMAPLRISEDHLTKITVCTRPFRPAGPRLEAEKFGEKTVIHNYGHGGSGWSLSWGCAEDALALARATGAMDFAVVGAGIIGLTTALRLAQSGGRVTIYAKDLPSETRSARATGVWSPSSRIALHDAAPQGFEETWERWARLSYEAHKTFATAPGEPVRTQAFYPLRAPDGTSNPIAQQAYMHLDRRIRDMTPRSRSLTADEHAFPVASAREGSSLVFNIEAYTQLLLREFYAAGGTLIQRTFPDRAAALSLDEPVILNCTGYGAKALWGADDLEPVRGQINWMPAQPEAAYGLFYKSVYVLSRGDGLVVQYVGPNDDYGFGLEDEEPDLEEMRRAINTVAPLFTSWA